MRKWGSVCLGCSWIHTGLRGTTTLHRREKVTLDYGWPGAHDKGGILVLVQNMLNAIIYRCIHLINICAFEVQMVAKDSRKHSIGHI